MAVVKKMLFTSSLVLLLFVGTARGWQQSLNIKDVDYVDIPYPQPRDHGQNSCFFVRFYWFARLFFYMKKSEMYVVPKLFSTFHDCYKSVHSPIKNALVELIREPTQCIGEYTPTSCKLKP